MIAKSKIRQRIMNRIKNLSDDKLNFLEKYMDDLENKVNQKSEILSYSGIFKDLDQDIIDELTIDLSDQRSNENSRIP
jgi:hypothetical protein